MRKKKSKLTIRLLRRKLRRSESDFRNILIRVLLVCKYMISFCSVIQKFSIHVLMRSTYYTSICRLCCKLWRTRSESLLGILIQVFLVCKYLIYFCSNLYVDYVLTISWIHILLCIFVTLQTTNITSGGYFEVLIQVLLVCKKMILVLQCFMQKFIIYMLFLPMYIYLYEINGLKLCDGDGIQCGQNVLISVVIFVYSVFLFRFFKDFIKM